MKCSAKSVSITFKVAKEDDQWKVDHLAAP
jgi:hypothetical protein